MKKWIPIVVVTLLAFVLIAYKVKATHPEWFQWLTNAKNQTVDSAEGTHQPKNNQSKKNNKTPTSSTQVKHRNKDLGQHFVFNTPKEKKLAKRYPDKFNIVRKMYYSWDNIHNAEGVFVSGNSKKDRNQTWFHVNLDNQKNRAKNEIYQNGKIIQTMNFLLKDGVITREMPNKHIFSKEVIKGNKKYGSNYGLDQYTEITQSQYYFLIYDDYTYWHYQSGVKFGMPVYEISGSIPEFISTNLGKRFTMTVSKKTGALLGLKCYDHHNKLIYFVNVKKIKINQGIPASVFHLDVSGDKKLSVQAFRSKTVGAQAVSTKK